MTKQVALDQRFRNRGAIDGNVRTVPARRELVNELSRDLFSGPAFTGDQNRHIGGGDTFDQAHDPAHRYRLANHDELPRGCFPSPPPFSYRLWINSPSPPNTSTIIEVLGDDFGEWVKLRKWLAARNFSL
jgi:hypothetical protein